MAAPALDLADIRAVQRGVAGELLLRPALQFAQMSRGRSPITRVAKLRVEGWCSCRSLAARSDAAAPVAVVARVACAMRLPGGTLR